jgi:plastocyanin
VPDAHQASVHHPEEPTVPNELSGLPTHPLIVHLPVVLVPLALLGALVALLRPRWRTWLLPLVAGATGVAAVAVQLAIGTGRHLEGVLGDSDLIDRHRELGEQTRPLVVVFFLVAAAVAVVDRRARSGFGDDDGGGLASAGAAGRGRFTPLLVPLCVVSVLAGAVATTWLVRTGDAGSKAVWQGEIGYEKRTADGDGDQGGGEGQDADGDDRGTGGSGSGSGSGEAKAATVKIVDFSFDPPKVTVKVGAEVTWTNADTAKHSVVGDDDPKLPGTEDLGQGDDDHVTFDEPGTYTYYCGFHEYMTGTVVVTR